MELLTGIPLTDEQLDTEIQDIIILADFFDDPMNYVEKLGLSRADSSDVRQAKIDGTQTAMCLALTKWRDHNPSAATFRALLKILMELRKEHVAKDICDYISDKF